MSHIVGITNFNSNVTEEKASDFMKFVSGQHGVFSTSLKRHDFNVQIVLDLFNDLKARDVNVYEVVYVLREAFVRMNEREDYEDYSKEEINSIIDLLTIFGRKVQMITYQDYENSK